MLQTSSRCGLSNAMTMLRLHCLDSRLARRLLILFFVASLLIVPQKFVVEAQMTVHVNVILRNRIYPGQVIKMDCMLNDGSIDPKGFLTTTSGSTVMISEQLGPDDTVFCDFTLGFVPKDLIQVSVRCTTDAGCSPLSMDFTNEGVYFNLTNGTRPEGEPDQPWSSLLPLLPPTGRT